MTHLTGPRLVAMLAGRPLPRPAYRSLAEALRILVIDGRIPAHTTMPSERDLTDALGVSRTTVGRCYDLLRESGYLVARQGSGHVVTLPRGARRVTTSALFPNEVPEDAVDLTCAGTRAPAGLVEASERAVAALPGFLAGAGYLPFGVAALRELVAQRYEDRGLPTTPDQILVTNGAVAAMATAIQTVVRRGDRVVVEHPSYPNTFGALRVAGARLAPAPMAGHAWDLDALTAAITSGAKVACLIPDFHNPTGALLADAGRARVAASMKRAGVVAIIDETFCDMVLDPIQMPLPFAAHAPDAVLVGSAAKSFWGGLRLGWIRTPHRLATRMLEARMSVDPGASVLNQLVLVELMARSRRPDAARLADLRAARDATVDALAEHLPHLDVHVPAGGLLLWLDLQRPIASAVAVAAEAEGLFVASGPRFAVGDGLHNWVRLPFVLAPDQMREGVARLARAMSRVDAAPAAAPRWRPLSA